MEKVLQVINNCKKKYGDRFLYYVTGSYARREKGFTDYDISIVDTKDNKDGWSDLLKRFEGQSDSEGRSLHAQINQYIPIVLKMNAKEFWKNRNMQVKRIYYRENDQKIRFPRVVSLGNHLWEHECNLIGGKHRKMGLIEAPFASIRI